MRHSVLIKRAAAALLSLVLLLCTFEGVGYGQRRGRHLHRKSAVGGALVGGRKGALIGAGAGAAGGTAYHYRRHKRRGSRR